jgi:hypothetical protein
MSKDSDARIKLDRLGEALAKDLDALSDDELMEEIAATDEERQKTVSHMRSLIEEAIATSGQRRLAKARQAYDAIRGKARAKVTELPLDRKKALVAHFAKNPQALPEKLTMAARNEANSEADLDSLLQDLLELGAIDDEGNPR